MTERSKKIEAVHIEEVKAIDKVLTIPKIPPRLPLTAIKRSAKRVMKPKP